MSRRARTAVAALLVVAALAGCSSPKKAAKDEAYPTSAKRPAARAWLTDVCKVLVPARSRAAEVLSLPSDSNVGTKPGREEARALLAKQSDAAAQAFERADHTLADLGTPKVADGTELASNLRSAVADAGARYGDVAKAIRRSRISSQKALEDSLTRAVVPLRESNPRLDESLTSLRGHRTIGPLVAQLKVCQGL